MFCEGSVGTQQKISEVQKLMLNEFFANWRAAKKNKANTCQWWIWLTTNESCRSMIQWYDDSDEPEATVWTAELCDHLMHTIVLQQYYWHWRDKRTVVALHLLRWFRSCKWKRWEMTKVPFHCLTSLAMDLSITNSISQTIAQSIRLAVDQWINESVPTNRLLINEPISKSIYQTANQPIK